MSIVANKNKFMYLGLVVIWLVALSLRLYQLGAESLWMDEILDYYTSRLDFLSMLADVRSHRGGLPLHYFVNFLIIPFAYDEIALRLPAVLFNSAAVVSTFLFARVVYKENPLIAWLAALLMVLSVFQIRYAQESRFYSLFILMSTLLWWRYFVACQTNQYKHWLIYGAIAIGASYTHYYTFLILMVQGCLVFFPWLKTYLKKDKNITNQQFSLVRAVFLVCVTTLILFIPALILYTSKLTYYQEAHFDWNNLLFFLNTLTGSIVIWLFILVGLFFQQIHQDNRNSWGLFLASLFFIAIVIVLDEITGYFFHVRQIVFIQPILFILCAAGITGIINLLGNKFIIFQHKRTRIGMIIIAIGIIVAIQVPSIGRYYQPRHLNEVNYGFEIRKAEWRQTADYLMKKNDKRFAIFVVDHFVKRALEYYFQLKNVSNIPVIDLNYDIKKMNEIIDQKHYQSYYLVDGGVFESYVRRLPQNEQEQLTAKLSTEKSFYKTVISKIEIAEKRVVSPVNKIDIGSKSAVQFLGDGWWQNEKTNKGIATLWSYAKQSELILPLSDSVPIKLVFKINSIADQKIKFRINQGKYTELNVSNGWHQYAIDANNYKWKRGNNIIIFNYTKSQRFDKYRKSRAVEWDYCDVVY